MLFRKFLFPLVCVLFPMLFTLNATADEAVKLHGAIIQEENVIISWFADWESPGKPEEIVIRYNRAVVLANKGEIWNYTDPIPYSEGYFELNDLKPSNSYVYQLGYLKSPGLEKFRKTMSGVHASGFKPKCLGERPAFCYLLAR